MTKHEADVIGGLNMTDQISNEAYKQIMIAAQDENEPCEDCISRQAVLDATINKNSIWNKITNAKGENLEKIISQLPPAKLQEPKSEWQQDHEILKAYSDGASAVLDKIRAEIIELRSRQNVGVMECLDIIDKYMAEEGKA